MDKGQVVHHMNLWNHFWSMVYHLSPSDWINLGVSAGTIAMAIYTAKAVRDSRDSIDAATRSAAASEANAVLMKDSIQASLRNAAAAELNAERMKDALKPYLDLEIVNARDFPIGVNDAEELRRLGTSAVLIVRNTGTGPARIGMLSYRGDFSSNNATDSIWMLRGTRWTKARMTDAILASGEELAFLLQASQSSYSELYVSSLSIFYEDVYGRKYRTRLLYTVQNDVRERVYMGISKEMLDLTTSAYPIDNDIFKIYALEGGTPALYNPTWESLHRLGRLEQLKGSVLSGTSFSNGKSLCLIGVSFTSDYPDFTLQVDGFDEFVLQTWTSDNRRQYRILMNNNKIDDYKEVGLNPSGNTDQDLAGLYRHVLTNGLGTILPGVLFM